MNQEVLKKSEHQQRVEAFMRPLGVKDNRQLVPARCTVPPEETRWARARLILEEALELIEALGFWVAEDNPAGEPELNLYAHDRGITLVDIVDGCCDVKVVVTGTLSACGVPDLAVQREVDENNLQKLHRGTIDEHGKLIKPADHVPPRLDLVLSYIDGARRVSTPTT